ncbi:hypothetical protein LNQ03_16950 [Klebsiella pneumoniae subsp. pneumoniae]|nr:hypothetical protein [Klebsiella pneumoniae subsp. pneumoniae]
MKLRATVLGHIQRGGSRFLTTASSASRMGAYAIELLLGRPWRPLRRHPEREAGAPRHHRCHRENMKRPFKNDWLDCAKKLY